VTTTSTGTAAADPKLAAIREFTAAGYALIPLCSYSVAHEHMTDGGMQPCKTPGKVPVGKNWRATAPGSYTPETLAQGNYGVLLLPGDLVIDVDPRNFKPGDKPLQRLMADIGAPLKTLVVRTGGGGWHIYLRKPADILVRNSLKEYPGIEFKSHGRQVVGPGSQHISGKKYEVASGAIHEITEAPPVLLALISRPQAVFDDVGTGDYVNDAPTQARYLDYLQHQAPTSGSYVVACRGRDLGLPPAITLELMNEAWNPRRASGPRSLEELRVRVEHAYRYARGAVGNAHPAAAFDAIVTETPKKKEEEGPLAWNTGPQGQVLKTFNNLMNYLRDPKYGLRGVFGYNEFTGRNEFTNPAPWHRGRMPAAKGVGDKDLKMLKGYLASSCGYDTNIQSIEEAVTNVSDRHSFHPVREYLESLKWDGVKRLDFWMHDYLGALDGGFPEYLAAVSRKVLCAAVMRVMRPGIEFHHVVVLEGAQDLGKSATCKILAGPWGSDATVDPHDRDTVDQMQGRWICEMAEMETLRRTDEDALKAFITRSTDRVRLAYGRTTGEFARQSIFIATKNPGVDGTYLKDSTGNRRWWPVRLEPRVTATNRLGQIDFRGLKEARNQLFAEAMHAVKTEPGEKLSMDTPLLKEQAKAVVSRRHAEHSWTEAIAAWLEKCDATPEMRRDFWTTREIFVNALTSPDRALDRRSEIAIGEVMRSLGWTATVKWLGRPVRGYERKTEDEKALDKVAAEL
jgi:predicted P-loop ATPase